VKWRIQVLEGFQIFQMQLSSKEKIPASLDAFSGWPDLATSQKTAGVVSRHVRSCKWNHIIHRLYHKSFLRHLNWN
jgi:hypothetical protein